MRIPNRISTRWLAASVLATCSGIAAAQFGGAPTCPTPATYNCPDSQCPGAVVINQGNVVDMDTRRTYFLDYPCDLAEGETVTFVLNLHGGGSYGNWQRHYFPIKDYVNAYRLVVATPNSPLRVWSEADDGYLQNIVNAVVEQFGRENIRAFWLAGHSQGGATSQRIICTDFFSARVDGFLSLSGGRVGGSPGRGEGFGNIGRGGAAAARGGAARGGAGRGAANLAGGAGAGTDCDFSHIYTTGEHEIGPLPEGSARAEKYNCQMRVGPREIVDTAAGYVFDSTRLGNLSRGWGLLPGPGTAQVFEYRGCEDGRVVADVVRIDKGHTEGLEPQVTAELVKLMVSAAGGKLQRLGD